MDIRQLKYFATVAECGSFTTAAAMIPIAQSALSRHVRDLEDELHQPLFYRNGRGVQLTEQGKTLLGHARAILDRLQQAKDELAPGRMTVAGRVSIGMPPSISRSVAAPLILDCKSRFPDLTLVAVEGHSMNIIEWELSGRIDIGLVYDPPSSSAYHSVPMLSTRLYLISSARSKSPVVVARPSVTLRDISRLPLILPCRPHAIRSVVDAGFRKAGLAVTLVREVEGASGMATILDFVESGEGHAILPLHSSLADARRLRRSLRYQEIVDPVLSLVLHMIVPVHRAADPTIHRITELLRSFAPDRINDVERSGRAAIIDKRRLLADRASRDLSRRGRARRAG